MTTPSNSEIPLLRGPVALSHLLMRSFVRPGDKAVDATCGNGHDTLLLAALTGSQGHVWGFDIQQQAIAETARKLVEAGLGGQVTLLHSGHEELATHLAGPVRMVLFNLGYLPGGDRTLITRPETTAIALLQSLELLAAGGVVLVTIYPGHDGGDEERQAVDGWAAALDPRKFHSWHMGQLNVAADAPYCIIVQKSA
ncbi:MAG: class I SAM-dependent methyltransferase [Steroidobacteraceae bacterium]|nr:class I SAM-dependent methyltransferase [Deltaproteobacteria bacterium]